jgi:site-specific DNA-methyltransferase (adenine-specific)
MEGDWVMDFFGGSGTTGAVAAKLNRRFVLVDQNPEAIDVIRKRIGNGTLDSTVSYINLEEISQ